MNMVLSEEAKKHGLELVVAIDRNGSGYTYKATTDDRGGVRRASDGKPY